MSSDEIEKKKGVLGAAKFKKLEKSKRKNRDPIFVGIDPSYNGFAIIALDKDANIIERKLIKTDSKKDIEQRILDLEKEFKFVSNIMSLEGLYIEGPAYQSSGAFMLQMGALHFYLRIFLYKKGTKFSIIAPGALKKFITGKGNAKKNLMLMSVYKKFGVEFDDDNLADAYSLARMALEEYKENEQNS